MTNSEGLPDSDIEEMIRLGRKDDGTIDYGEVVRAANAATASINFLNMAFE